MSASEEPGDRSDRLLRAVAGVLPVVVWTMDPSGTLTMAIGGDPERMGFVGGPPVGANLLELVADNADAVANYRRALAGEAFTGEAVHAGVAFSTWYEPVLDQDGAVVEVVAVSADVTDAVRARERRREIDDRERALLLQLVAAQDVERREVGDAIHDDTLQALATAQIRMELLARRLEQEGRGDLTDDVAPVQQALSEAVARLRSALFALAPPDLGDGLAAALRDLAAAALETTGIRFEVVDRSAASVPESVARVLYQVAREALANVARHSQANAVVLTLTSDGDGHSLTVVDDGVGAPSEGLVERPGHRGIAAMGQRVDAAGGTLRLWSGTGSGTSVSAWVPGRAGALLADGPVLDLKEPLREILDEADEAFVAFDRDWRYVFVNRPAANLVRREARDLEGRHVWAEFPHLIGSPFHVQCLSAMARQKPVEYSDFFDGRWLEVRLVPTSRGLFAYFRDVTAARRSRRAQPRVDDAGTVVLTALRAGAVATTPADRVQAILDAVVGGRWFAAARVVLPGGRVLASSSGPSDPDDAGRPSVVLNERLPGSDEADLEVEGSFPTHEAVRWAVRVLAASLAPDVGAVTRGG